MYISNKIESDTRWSHCLIMFPLLSNYNWNLTAPLRSSIHQNRVFCCLSVRISNIYPRHKTGKLTGFISTLLLTGNSQTPGKTRKTPKNPRKTPKSTGIHQESTKQHRNTPGKHQKFLSHKLIVHVSRWVLNLVRNDITY